MKSKFLNFNLYIGLFALCVAALLLILNVPFMKTWLYNFVWWPFILILDSVNFRMSKASPLSQSRRDFFYMAFLSVFVWLLFEIFNLRVENWTYQGLPQNLTERWLGYFVAFSSVIPAMKELSLFFESVFKGRKVALFRITASPLLLRLCVLTGFLSVVLTLVWPQIFFPFVWLCFIFLLEPLNFRLRNDSLLKDLERNDWRRFFSWILSGLLAGIFWEFWNFWAGSHWEYFLPYLNFWKIFQMPFLGYTGFLPFALEIFAIYAFLSGLLKKVEQRILLKSLAFVFFLFFFAWSFYLIDAFTVVP